jgi:hypothetical protein
MPKVVQVRSCGEKELRKQKSFKWAFICAFSRIQVWASALCHWRSRRPPFLTNVMWWVTWTLSGPQCAWAAWMHSGGTTPKCCVKLDPVQWAKRKDNHQNIDSDRNTTTENEDVNSLYIVHTWNRRSFDLYKQHRQTGNESNHASLSRPTKSVRYYIRSILGQ